MPLGSARSTAQPADFYFSVETRPRAVGLLFVLACVLAVALPASRADVTYTLHFDPASSGQAQQVANSVAVAAAFYNQHGSFNKHWNVYYNPGIPTAEGNYDGYMGYGGTRNERVVFHEAAHTFGMGTHWTYPGLVSGGWKGQYGNQALSESYGGTALGGDDHAIWPGGFNFDNEDGYLARFYHVRVMAGIRADMGILSFTRETSNEAVVAGETAEFRVESPMAATYQWQKNGIALTNGGDISGANTATLRIANADTSDAGAYRCVVTGAGETLACRPRQLWVHAVAQLGQWDFNGTATSSVGTHHGAAFGSPAYVAGKIGQAVDLDGIDDYIDLPDAVGRLQDLTIAAWVNWDGGGDWQRVFDFGTGTSQFLCLTPRAGGGSMRVAFKDAVNLMDVEYQVNTSALPIGQWVHLAVVLKDDYLTLYVNGRAVGSAFGIPRSVAGFPATNNFIGKSQFPDPLFNGRIDDLRTHGKALTGAEIWSLWGQSANRAPVFSAATITAADASAVQPYAGQSIAPFASDADGNPLTFTKLSGPAWLAIAPNGALSGQPGGSDGGMNQFLVRVTDPSGASSDATLQIFAFAPALAPVTSGSTAPVPDGDDASYFASNIGEPGTIGGTNVSGDNDESTYVAENRSSKGQSFTTGANPGGYFLQSFTFQHVNWPAFTENGTYYDIQPGDQWEFQIGTLNGAMKSPIVNYTAVYDYAAFAGAANSGTGRYLTFNVSGLGVLLSPNTTYYFEIAPLSGDPYLELNSSRNGTYAGGTAFRGSTNGTISTSVNVLSGDYIFHARLDAKTTASTPGTIAYWNFEEGPANSHVLYPRATVGQYQGSIRDRSGNANHLSVHGANWHWFRALVPAASTSQTGAANTLSLQNANAFPSISAIGTPLTTWSPTAWTIEAAIRPDDATASGFQTFIGRDSQGAAGSDPALAALYFTVTPQGALGLTFTDAAGNVWSLTSVANVVQDGKWHAAAATSDGNTLSLYLKNLTNGDAAYTLLGTLNITASTNPAMSTGLGDGGDWDAGVFTVARGLYNGGHTDRFFGHIDDVRLTEGKLAPSAFLYSLPLLPPPTYTSWINSYPSVGSQNGFSDDPDGDGLANGVENLLGSDPAKGNGWTQNIGKIGNTVTFRHSQNPNQAADVSGSYRWSLDLQNWNASGANAGGTTVTINVSPNTPAAGTTTVTATISGAAPSGVFIRLQAAKN